MLLSPSSQLLQVILEVIPGCESIITYSPIKGAIEGIELLYLVGEERKTLKRVCIAVIDFSFC